MVAVLAAMCPIARGAIAAGTYTMEFDGNVTLWDVSGSYTEDIGGISIDYTLSVDPAGKITGYGSADYGGGYGINIDMTFKFSGTVKTVGAITRVSLSMTMKGSGTVQGYTFGFTASIQENMEIDTDAYTMVGTTSGKITLSVRGRKASQAIPKTEITLELPYDMDGSWDLSLNVTPNKTKLAGTGRITLSNGTVYDFNVSGTYTLKTDLSNIAMKGAPANKAMTANIVANCGNLQMNVKTLKGKALGQTITYIGGS
jgi:hypothetical protein